MPKTVTVEDYGFAKTTQKIVPGNTATGIGSEISSYIERTLAYTSGGTTEIVAGDLIVGATSGATATVLSVTLTSGTWAGGDAAGTLRLKGQVGTFQSENVKVAAGTDEATIAGNSTAVSSAYLYKGNNAVAVLLSCRDNDALLTMDGTKPDQTSLVGHTLAANGSIVIQGENNIKNVKVIDRVSGSASIISATCFYRLA